MVDSAALVGPDDGLLDALGLAAIHSTAYLLLIERPLLPVTALADALGCPRSRAQEVLERLQDSGLIDRVPGEPARYLVAPPDVAIDAVVLRRQEALDGLRARARELLPRLADAPSPFRPDLVELISGEQEIVRVLAELELGAREEVLMVDTPPYVDCARGGTVLNTIELRGLERGVRYRVIYHAPSLAQPERMARLRQYLDAGEQARALGNTVMKMVVVDGRTALVPTRFPAESAEQRLLVRSPALVAALVQSFEHLWSLATPLVPHADDDRPFDDKHAQVLQLLATGAKDLAIARALGVTPRTVIRRIRDLMDLLGADTRFQAGAFAARKGWL